jgi:hypothetical protein
LLQEIVELDADILNDPVLRSQEDVAERINRLEGYRPAALRRTARTSATKAQRPGKGKRDAPKLGQQSLQLLTRYLEEENIDKNLGELRHVGRLASHGVDALADFASQQIVQRLNNVPRQSKKQMYTQNVKNVPV